MHPMDTVEDVRNIQQSLWELHKLLTDLPDDMLEDSRDSSSLELDCSACSNTDTRNRAKLCEVNGEMVAVQDCYISLCKDEDRLEENLQGRRMDEEERRENEMKRSWAQRFEADARRQRPTETQESSSQTDLTEKEEKACQTSSSERTKAAPGCTMEELDTRLWEQKLQREADLARRRAVEDAGKRVQRELQEKHLEDMAKQVEGAASRVYSRWLQDVPSLPGYKATLQREREKWEKVQEKHVQQQMSLVLTVAEERRQEERPRSSGQVQRVEEMHRCSQLEKKDLKTEVEEVAHLQSQVAHLQSQVAHLQSQVAHLQSQLDREREEKAALLKAEMAAARASWNRDKQQEISSLQAFQEEQLKRARDEAQGEVELLLQKEAELQQALRDQEEDWRRQEESRGQEHRQAREEMLQELQAGLKEVQTMLLKGGAHKEKENGGEVEGRWRTSGSIKELLMSTCKYLISKAVAQAKIEWKRISEEGLGRVLKERRERQEKELNQIHNDHEVALWKENLQELEEMKRCAAKESSGRSDMEQRFHADLEQMKEQYMEQRFHAGLEQMKEQYMKAVEEIRGDMLRYLQQSKERAAEMIRVEVLRERQDTARKMRRYYLTCLQEVEEDGRQATGAEKKIINVASKLAAMAKELETPTKRTRGKSHSLPGSSLKTEAATDSHPGNASGSIFIKTQCPASHLPETTRSGRGKGRTLKTNMNSDLDSKTSSAAVKTTRTTRPMSKPTHQEPLTNGKEKGAPADTAGKPHISSGLFLSLPPHKPSHQIGQTFLDCYHGEFTNVTLRTQTSRELYLQVAESERSDDDNFPCHRSNTKTSLVQEFPVRDGGGLRGWSTSSNESQDGRHILAVNSYPDRKIESETVPSAWTFFDR